LLLFKHLLCKFYLFVFFCLCFFISSVFSNKRYVRSTQPAVIDELDSRKAEEPCCVSRLSLAALMLQVAGTSDTDKVLEADRLCVVMEATTPRRSARLADKMRQNYAHAVPWWLQNEAEWTN
jgi:hypothetical protein